MKPNPPRSLPQALVLLFAACVVLAGSLSTYALQAPPRSATPPGRPTTTPTPARPPTTTTTPPPRTVPTPVAQPTSPQVRPTVAPTPTPQATFLDFTLVKNETLWRDWLWLLIGVLFFTVAGYMIYTAMLHNLVRANWHPANFRKLLIALVLLLSIIWFGYVFRNAFGLIMLIILLAVWLAVVLVFIFTKRKGVVTQE